MNKHQADGTLCPRLSSAVSLCWGWPVALTGPLLNWHSINFSSVPKLIQVCWSWHVCTKVGEVFAVLQEWKIIKFWPWCQVGRRACSCLSGALWLSPSYDTVKYIRLKHRCERHEACVGSFLTCLSLPALVHLDLLLNQLSVRTLSHLLGHCHQLDQLRPEDIYRWDWTVRYVSVPQIYLLSLKNQSCYFHYQWICHFFF